MNLNKTFPEVEAFFVRQQFTNEELLSFIKEVEEKYQDKQLRNSISSVIKLKMLQYELLTHKVLVSETRVKSKSNKLSKEVKNYHPKMKVLKSSTIDEIAVTLCWSTSKILTLLQQKGINRTHQATLESKEFETLNEMFNSRLLALDRIKKARTPKKIINNRNKQKSLSKKNDVYSKIEAIGLGKLIYIRKQ